MPNQVLAGLWKDIVGKKVVNIYYRPRKLRALLPPTAQILCIFEKWGPLMYRLESIFLPKTLEMSVLFYYTLSTVFDGCTKK